MTGEGLVVIGEVLAELSAPGPLRDGSSLTLGFSGDALNAAAAAAAAGARVRLLTRVADDDLGDLLIDRVAALGVDTSLVRRVPGQGGVYFVSADPSGVREFCYARRGSAACSLVPEDLPDLSRAVVLASGITCAISSSAGATVLAAARAARTFVYDPNFRPRLTTAAEAHRWLTALAPHARLVTPAFPGDDGVLPGVDDAEAAARACRRLGARAAAVTRGADGVVLVEEGAATVLPALPAPVLVDQTGAGDVFTGTTTARLALGEGLSDAVRLGMAAASLSLAGQGGTGRIPTLDESRAHRLVTEKE